jgi:hypothetical protein
VSLLLLFVLSLVRQKVALKELKNIHNGSMVIEAFVERFLIATPRQLRCGPNLNIAPFVARA